ncbi:76cd9196-5507-44c9-8a41-5ea8f22c281b [Thermothielavioides terrestris]|uniref:Dynactin subunit n=2 Tax=Thermothielavioides terrestris TaxID=2587410 RepID=G2REC3_THETT|nr:uncharacterized protein THITE_2171199 [Thermothielavioides terrestris NRRL 8126]AEO70095.1 hypothetical protein THITE_2171199 [Thermothielavioides terrestris NRRL 8126]SPQ17895.1 76cd9196-5507-44c9-8a41-5ea8f22c281b [Thermothielavioides terrestris]
MSSNRKYAALPDLDSAPDIYETPDLTDDHSTVPPTTVQSPSDNEYDEDEEHAAGISRSRLRVREARSKFMPAAVDANDVDFSDRLDGKRKSYKTSTRRHRVLEDGTEELGDLSDEDDAVNLARKIARLRREIEVVKDEYGKQKAAAEKSKEERVTEDDIESLSKVLDEISRFDDSLTSRHLPATVPPPAAVGQNVEGDPTDGVSYTITYAPSYEQTHALAKAADFDRRLVVLEKALGVGSAAMPEFDSNGLPRAIIPLLEHLHKQISTLSEASVPSLDSISRRVRALTQEAEALEKARRNAKAAHEALASAGAAPTAEATAIDDSEQTAKINALYGTLPTIENLAPLLPPLLDRLRSLRMIHAEAATASQTLERIEKKQADMAAEIQQWREGLEKVEAAVREGDATMVRNMDVMSRWVKDLEDKMSKLSP